MVLLTLGSQPLICDRIVNAVLDANIKDKLVVQAYYKPTKEYDNVTFYDFVSYDEMEKLINEASIVITSGTGSIFRVLQSDKKLIIFPRLGRYGEATDDHGLDMKVLADDGFCEFVTEGKDFKKTYERCIKNKYKKFQSNTSSFIEKLVLDINKL